MPFLESAGAAFLLILLAEFGDKTQLVLIGLAARGRKVQTLLGAVAAFAVLTGLAVLAADLVGRLIPDFWIGLVGGALFLAFGILVLREALLDDHSDAAAPDLDKRRAARGAFTSAFVLVGLAELGDKTQIAVAVLAADSAFPLAIGLGAWLALALLSAVALLVGGLIARTVPPRIVRIAAGVLFLVVGLFLVLAGIRDAGAPLGTLFWS